jgi:hypothetical protein
MNMQTTKQKSNREAVARSLRELEILFGKKLPDKNDKGREQAANVGSTGILTLRGAK